MFRPKDSEKLNRFIKNNKILAFVIIIILIIIFPFVSTLFILLVSVLNSLLFNERSVPFSSHVGKKIELAPYAIISKMTNYGDWTDRYEYIFASPPRSGSNTYLKEHTTYEVIDEKIDTGRIFGGSGGRVCILKKKDRPSRLVSIRCDEIEQINKNTQKYYYWLNEVETNKGAYLLTRSFGQKEDFDLVISNKKYDIYKINNAEEVRKMLIPPGDEYGIPYGRLMNDYRYRLVKKEDLSDEKKILDLLEQ